MDWQLNNGRAVHTGPFCRGGDTRSSQTAFTPHRKKKRRRRRSEEGKNHQKKNEEERKHTRKLFTRINISLQSVDLLSAKCQAALAFFCLPLPSPIYIDWSRKPGQHCYFYSLSLDVQVVELSLRTNMKVNQIQPAKMWTRLAQTLSVPLCEKEAGLYKKKQARHKCGISNIIIP